MIQAKSLQLDKRDSTVLILSMHGRREPGHQVCYTPAHRLMPMEQTPVKCCCAAVHTAEAPQCLAARGYHRLGCAVTEPREEIGQREAAR
jgi:hypothetical protein